MAGTSDGAQLDVLLGRVGQGAGVHDRYDVVDEYLKRIYAFFLR